MDSDSNVARSWRVPDGAFAAALVTGALYVIGYVSQQTKWAAYGLQWNTIQPRFEVAASHGAQLVLLWTMETVALLSVPLIIYSMLPGKRPRFAELGGLPWLTWMVALVGFAATREFGRFLQLSTRLSQWTSRFTWLDVALGFLFALLLIKVAARREAGLKPTYALPEPLQGLFVAYMLFIAALGAGGSEGHDLASGCGSGQVAIVESGPVNGTFDFITATESSLYVRDLPTEQPNSKSYYVIPLSSTIWKVEPATLHEAC